MSIPFFAPPEWAWQLVEPTTSPPVFVGPLTTATARQLDFPIDGPATAQFTMPGIVDQSGPAPETALIVELATDLLVTRNGRPVFRGRIGTSADTHANDADTVQFTAIDYRGLLDHRIIWPGSQLVFDGTHAPNEQTAIAWKLIADTQATTGGDLGISEGSGIGTTGVTRARTYTAGVPLGQTLDELANVENGFEWEVDTDLAFNVFHPQRFRDQTASQVLALGRGLTALVSTVNTDAYANAVFYTGHQPETTPIQQVPPSGIPAGIGRWESQVTDPNVILQTTADEQAKAARLNAQQIDPAFTLTMSPAWWEPGDIWLGDLIQVQVDDGRLGGDNAVDVSRRVVNIAITLDDDGTETVVLTANVPVPPDGTTDPPPPPAPGGAGKVPKLSRRLHRVDHRLSKLELVAAGAAGPPPTVTSVYANIADYGGVPTTISGGNIPSGAFDNASALAAALATGKPAWVPEGVWAISSLSPATPAGTGEIVIEGRGILFAKDGTSDLLLFSSGQRVTLRGLTFSTHSSTGIYPAVYLSGVAWALVEDCNFAGQYLDAGVSLGWQAEVVSGSTDVTFSGCTFVGGLNDSGQLTARGITNLNVTGCYFRVAPPDIGAASMNTLGVNISGCLFDNTGSSGVLAAEFGASTGFQTTFNFSANTVRANAGIQVAGVNGPFLIASNNFVSTATDALSVPSPCTNGRVAANYGTPDRTF